MRGLSAVLLCCLSSSLWAGVAMEKLESFSAQLSPSWKILKPACIMALEPNIQSQLSARINFLDEKLIASDLLQTLQPYAQDTAVAWQSPLWAKQKSLEANALTPENREPLREYFFKLQTQTPNKERAQLVNDIQAMSLDMNFTLRKELWKTCHALGLSQVPLEQMETAVEQHWLVQNKKVWVQLKRELSAFYFYSFRQTGNDQLQGFAKLAKDVKPWVDHTSAAITAYFVQLRSQLVNTPLVFTPDPVAEPFLEDRPWRPSPSQGLLAP